MTAELREWILGQLGDWFPGPVEVAVDRDEILVIGTVDSPDVADEQGRRAATEAIVKQFREDTRARRVAVAEAVEHRFGRTVSWGVDAGGHRYLFTHLAVPVMTRLRFRERTVLDTLIDGGIARSRSEALAWCVRLVERNQAEWIGQLRDAVAHVERARAAGPDL